MSLPPHVHVITPGDHYSPRTGSAVPTVVDGLTGARDPSAPGARVTVTRDSYPDRYPSAEPVEYDAPERRSLDRYLDAVRGTVGLPRKGAQRVLRAAVAEQGGWPNGVVFGHNLPQLVPLVDAARHAPVLYAHNNVLRSYTPAESGRVLGSAAAIVAVSSSLADQLHPHLTPSLAERVRIVVNGVDCERFRPDPDRVRGERLEVVMIGRMIRDKGPDVLLEALRLAARDDVAVTLVGSDGFDATADLTGYEQGLRAQARQVPGPVRFVPFVPRAELADLLRRADVLVVPSRWPDPCPLTVMEGLATGLAVVASDIGGIPEAMGDAGVLVPPNDPAALAGALSDLADHEAHLTSLRARGRAHAVAHDWAWAARNLDEALRGLS